MNKENLNDRWADKVRRQEAEIGLLREKLLGLVQTQRHANPVRPLLRLKGLDPQRDYRIDGRIYGGDELMYAGLALPFLDECQALQYHIEAV